MLVLGTNNGDYIRVKVGDRIIWIRLVSIKSPIQARIGIEAASDVVIHRNATLPPEERYHVASQAK